jgi:hypothetical protein
MVLFYAGQLSRHNRLSHNLAAVPATGERKMTIAPLFSCFWIAWIMFDCYHFVVYSAARENVCATEVFLFSTPTEPERENEAV